MYQQKKLLRNVYKEIRKIICKKLKKIVYQEIKIKVNIILQARFLSIIMKANKFGFFRVFDNNTKEFRVEMLYKRNTEILKEFVCS